MAASRRIDGPQWKFAACSGAKRVDPLYVAIRDYSYINNVVVRGNRTISAAVDAANRTPAREGRQAKVMLATKVVDEFNG